MNSKVDKRIIGQVREEKVLTLLARFGVLNQQILTAWIVPNKRTGARMIQRTLRRLLDRQEIVVHWTRDPMPVYGIARKGCRRLHSLDPVRWRNLRSSADFVRQSCMAYGHARHRLLGAGLIHSLYREFAQLQTKLSPEWDHLQVGFASEQDIVHRHEVTPLAKAGRSAYGRRSDGIFGIGHSESMEGYWIEIERSGKRTKQFEDMIQTFKMIAESATLADNVEVAGLIIASDRERFLRRVRNRLESEEHPVNDMTIYRLGGFLEWKRWPEDGKTLADVGEYGWAAQNNLRVAEELGLNEDGCYDEEEDDDTP